MKSENDCLYEIRTKSKHKESFNLKHSVLKDGNPALKETAETCTPKPFPQYSFIFNVNLYSPNFEQSDTNASLIKLFSNDT